MKSSPEFNLVVFWNEFKDNLQFMFDSGPGLEVELGFVHKSTDYRPGDKIFINDILIDQNGLIVFHEAGAEFGLHFADCISSGETTLSALVERTYEKVRELTKEQLGNDIPKDPYEFQERVYRSSERKLLIKTLNNASEAIEAAKLEKKKQKKYQDIEYFGLF